MNGKLYVGKTRETRVKKRKGERKKENCSFPPISGHLRIQSVRHFSFFKKVQRKIKLDLEIGSGKDGGGGGGEKKR